jgi:hypothetical protein
VGFTGLRVLTDLAGALGFTRDADLGTEAGFADLANLTLAIRGPGFADLAGLVGLAAWLDLAETARTTGLAALPGLADLADLLLIRGLADLTGAFLTTGLATLVGFTTDFVFCGGVGFFALEAMD